MRATERVIKEDHFQIRRALAVIEQMPSLVHFDRLWQPFLVGTVLRWLDEMEVRYSWRAHAPAY